MFSTKKFLVAFALITLAIACNNASESTESVADQSAAEPVSGSTFKSELDESKKETVDQTKADLNPAQPKLIKTGYLTLEVSDYKDFRKRIETLVKNAGGYLGNESESNETYRISNDILIRVPNAKFDALMGSLGSENTKTINRRIEVQDVGEEYADLEARIAAKKAVEARYLDILQKAGKISDILEIEEKLRVIREETEAAQGRVKYLNSQVAYSTINLSYYQVLDTKYEAPSGPGFFTRIWKGIVQGWEGLLDVVISIVYLWPLWLTILVVIWLIKRGKIRIWPFRRKA
jgi:hypothetical protein